MRRKRVFALLAASFGFAATALPSAAIGQAVQLYAESPADSLARNVRILADSPKDMAALIGAGKAALQLGDAQAAAGFFGRAEEVNPNSALAEAGMGAALVGTGDPSVALTYFTRAQQLGASSVSLGCDRGLAYDLLGNQVAAQTDYRAALAGQDRDEARRRLALSLAISGNKPLALTTLEPLLQRRDPASVRVRALVLALGGDLVSAKAALDSSMPGVSARMDPFFRRLPTLTSVQKAAAVHLGVFPESGSAMASAATTSGTGQAGPREDRLASIEQLLAQRVSQAQQPGQQQVTYSYAPPAPSVAVAQRQMPPVRLASVSRNSIERAGPVAEALIETKRVASSGSGRKIWLQLASSADPAGFTSEFNKIRARKPSLFSGISGFVAEDARARLVIGPFHSNEDARLFADALSSVRIDSSRWVSSPGQVVRTLPTQ